MDASTAVKDGIRRLIQNQGMPVKFEESYFAGAHYDSVSIYGWVDYNIQDHIRDDRCRWVIPAGVKVTERSYTKFLGTFVDNADEVGINAEGCHCACGRHINVTLRVVCGLGEAIQEILGYDDSKRMEL